MAGPIRQLFCYLLTRELHLAGVLLLFTVYVTVKNKNKLYAQKMFYFSLKKKTGYWQARSQDLEKGGGAILKE